MEKKKTHGGARKKAGRKPIEDKKQQINLFLEGSLIELHGGKEAVRQKCYAFLREGEKKIKNTSTNVKSKRSGSNGA